MSTTTEINESMIANHTMRIDERGHAVITALNIPHAHGTQYHDATQIAIQIDIPDDIVLSDAIRIDKDGNLTGSPVYPRLRRLDDGTPQFEGGIYSDGSPQTTPLRLDTRLLDLKDRIEDIVQSRIAAGTILTQISYIEDIAPGIAVDAEEIATAQPLVEIEAARQATVHETWLTEKAARDVRDAAERAEKTKKEEEEKAQQKIIKNRREAWIAAQGSDLLKIGHEKGYACQKRYAQEWGTAELGTEYVLDYDEKVSRKNRSCPSEEALAEQVRIEKLNLTDVDAVRVYWLPEGLDELDEDYQEGYNEPTPREAVEVKAHGVYYYKLF